MDPPSSPHCRVYRVTAHASESLENYMYPNRYMVTLDPAALVLDRFEAEQICRAIAALPEDYRVVSALYFMEEFSYQEIAEMVGCPVGTVRSRLHRGRRMLQKALWYLAEQQGIVADLRTREE